MATTDESNPLLDWYADRIGTPSTTDEAYGYWVFVVGVLAGFIGIALVMASNSPGQSIRGAGIALASLGLILLLIGPTIRLPLERNATLLSYLGTVIALAGVAWFFVEFTAGNWGAAFAHNEPLIIGVYGVGILVIAVGSVFTPLFLSPREAQVAAERRATEAEAERDVAAQTAETQSHRAEEQSKAAARAETERDELEAELQQIKDSQSQFELYTDSGGKHRWRLRHRNRNIIADSSQGYSSRQKAQQGLNAVKRDAFGGAVIDLDRIAAVEVEEVDDAVQGEGAPAFIDEIESQAAFETYEDAAGEYRWRLRHDNGNILADSSEGYASRRGRDDALDRVRYYVQTGEYLRIDPAAFELYRDRAGKFRWRLLHQNGNIIADSGQGYASRQKARQGIESVRSNLDEDGKADFEVYEDKSGAYRWRLVHNNGNIIADSGEGYASKSNARDAVEGILTYVPDAHILDIGSAAFEIYEDTAGEWRWRLRHRNGNIMADSGQGYAERSGAEDGLISVKQNAPDADIADEERDDRAVEASA